MRPSIDDYPAIMIPSRLRRTDPIRWREAGGRNNLRVFRLGEGPFARCHVDERLTLSPDKPGHGVIEPRYEMPLAEYEEAIHSTRTRWHDEQL